MRARHAEDGVVLIEVIDQGIGIPEADVARIFERFFQVDSTATRRFGGTGMGLALVKRVVDAHGATVEVGANTGGGTRVVLRWPESDEGTRDRGTAPGSIFGAGTMSAVALGGALAVPCTRNPL